MNTLHNGAIDLLEAEQAFKLPGLYRKLLLEVGFGESGDIQIYHPSEIRQLYQDHFDDPADLFHQYFPFGCNNRTQEIWLIDPKSERASSIWHETHPESYPEENWESYEDWVMEHGHEFPSL